MSNTVEMDTLDAGGMERFNALRADAVSAVTERFYATHGSVYRRFGARGREACREDLAFHLEFLRPVLEFGLVQPMVDYLCWLAGVLTARAIPAQHLTQSLDWLGEYFAGQMDVADGDKVTGALTAARDAFLAAGDAPPPRPLAATPWPEATEFEAALLAGRQRNALAVANRCLDDGRDLVDVEMHVMQPALYAIGEKWQANQVSVAQEHMATAIVQSVMTAGLLRAPPPPDPLGTRVLLACVEGNHHGVGLRMIADAFLLDGWDVQYLGTNVPARALVQQALAWQPHLVGLSISFPQQLPVTKQVIGQLAQSFGNRRPAVILGGLAINRFTQLAKLVGADAFSVNAKAALDLAKRVVSGHSLQ